LFISDFLQSVKPVYINGISGISAQPTFGQDGFLEEVVNLQTTHLNSIEPNYKELIPGSYLRRMSRVVRMGVTTARTSMSDAGIEHPDAIIVGTGMGCMRDTERFMTSIYESNENIASPNQFIQSTHNNVASQIAIMLGCDKYNATYVHRGFSFESSLMDACLQIEEHSDSQQILVGAMDESTEIYLEITRRLQQWKKQEIHQLDLLDSGVDGSLPGEGAHFFVVSGALTGNTYAQVTALEMIFSPEGNSLTDQFAKFFARQGISPDDIDLVLLGLNGDARIDRTYAEVCEAFFADHPLAYYKHLCGEVKTANAFATWLACRILKEQSVPEVIQRTPYRKEGIRSVLIYNNYSNIDHSLILLTHV
jgi:3-oxoacyl-(acyl-carrier-protein) synthase